jgi:hypothetical protein
MRVTDPVQYLATIPSPTVSVWHLGPRPNRAYALFILLGIVAACTIAEYRMRQRGARKWLTLDIALYAVPFGLVGGRLYHVITDAQKYLSATSARRSSRSTQVDALELGDMTTTSAEQSRILRSMGHEPPIALGRVPVDEGRHPLAVDVVREPVDVRHVIPAIADRDVTGQQKPHCMAVTRGRLRTIARVSAPRAASRPPTRVVKTPAPTPAGRLLLTRWLKSDRTSMSPHTQKNKSTAVQTTGTTGEILLKPGRRIPNAVRVATTAMTRPAVCMMDPVMLKAPLASPNPVPNGLQPWPLMEVLATGAPPTSISGVTTHGSQKPPTTSRPPAAINHVAPVEGLPRSESVPRTPAPKP